MPPRYYSVRETDSYTDAVLHTDRDCPAGPVRAAPPNVRGEWCPDCGPESDEEDSDEEDDPDICQVELSAGGTCGREKPCPYHD